MAWSKPLIHKEITFVYIVNHKKFLSKEEAEIYIRNLELKEIENNIDFASEHI